MQHKRPTAIPGVAARLNACSLLAPAAPGAKAAEGGQRDVSAAVAAATAAATGLSVVASAQSLQEESAAGSQLAALGDRGNGRSPSRGGNMLCPWPRRSRKGAYGPRRKLAAPAGSPGRRLRGRVAWERMAWRRVARRQNAQYRCGTTAAPLCGRVEHRLALSHFLSSPGVRSLPFFLSFSPEFVGGKSDRTHTVGSPPERTIINTPTPTPHTAN